jgi:hypothetical protein
MGGMQLRFPVCSVPFEFNITKESRTVLLLDSGDIALMNIQKVVDAVRSNFPSGLPDGVDELWYAEHLYTIGVGIPGHEAHDFRKLATRSTPRSAIMV